jgi:hypothetical protein
MDETTTRQVNKALALTGPIFVLGYLFFWGILGHNIPPPNMMAMTGQELVDNYYLAFPSIKVGMMMSAVFGLFYLPWSCLLASLLRDDNGQMSALGLMELTGGTLTAWLLAFCPALWAACAFMAGTADPEVIKLLHMGTWLIYDCTYMITTVQLTGLGLYTVLNKKQQIFPAWAGWSALAVGAVFIPLTLIAFVTEGPFALPGIWNFYIVFGTWLFAFFCVYSFYMWRHVSRPANTVARGAVHA